MGLITDPYNFVNGGVADADQVDERFLRLYNLVNGELEGDNLKTALAEILGVSKTGEVRRGRSVVAAEEVRTNVAYGLLGAAGDRVQAVVVPTDALLVVTYQAMWKESVNGAARAAFFIGANQLKVADSGVAAAPYGQEAQCSKAANIYGPLSSYAGGLTGGGAGAEATAYTGDVTTGQVIGQVAFAGPDQFGFCAIDVAAGTYDVSVQFKASSGSVTAKNRKLRVFTIGF